MRPPSRARPTLRGLHFWPDTIRRRLEEEESAENCSFSPIVAGRLLRPTGSAARSGPKWRPKSLACIEMPARWGRNGPIGLSLLSSLAADCRP